MTLRQSYYTYFRYLSLDIVLGAVLILAMLEKHYLLDLSWHIYFALASAVWIIYTIDHLLDAKADSPVERRKFHFTNFRALVLVCGCLAIVALVNVWFLPIAVIKNGALLAALCVAYLMLVYFVKGLWVKEFLVAIGYAGGIFLSPLSTVTSINIEDWLLFLQLVLVALINLCIFSYYDREEDQSEGFGSVTISLGAQKTRSFIIILMASSMLLSTVTIFSIPSIANLSSVFLAMTVILGLIFWLPSYFHKHERFRLIGDGVFYLPLLLLI